MTLTSNNALAVSTYLIDFTEDAEAEVVEGTGQSLALEEATGLTEAGDFIYSATAEGRTGEVAGAQGYDFDDAPGLIYSGPNGALVRVGFNDLDIVETNDEAPEATDTWTTALFVNNDVVVLCDEGWFAEIDTETAIETNIENGAAVTLQEGDVVRAVLLNAEGAEDDQTVDVAEGGRLYIVGG